MQDGRDAVDDARGGERPQRIQRRVRQRHAAQQRAGAGTRRRCRPRARRPSRARTRGRPSTRVPSSVVANSIIPIISAMPTGSFAPDSPSRIVPVRPPTSRRPSTENMTAGIGRRERGADAARDVVHEKPSSQCAASGEEPGGRERPERRRARGSARARRGTAASPTLRAAVEEDHDERDDADPLDRADRELAERREDVRERRRRRGGRAPAPGCGAAR